MRARPSKLKKRTSPRNPSRSLQASSGSSVVSDNICKATQEDSWVVRLSHATAATLAKQECLEFLRSEADLLDQITKKPAVKGAGVNGYNYWALFARTNKDFVAAFLAEYGKADRE